MVIDKILDRKDNEELMAQGYTHIQNGITGEVEPLAYEPANFYREIYPYGDVAVNITLAMDYGEESDVKWALCDYVIKNGYNPEICNYINSRNWLTV